MDVMKIVAPILFATIPSEALVVVHDLRWMIVLVVMLVLADFWFGVSASVRRNEEFRFSRAGRRTCNKFVEYMAYLLLGTLFGLAIFEPLGWATHTTTAAVALGLGCLWEVDSIIEHICELRGYDAVPSVKKIIIAYLKQRNQKVGDAVEQAMDAERETTNRNDMTIILDNGHGSNTPGKCSPDKQVREWRVVRDIVDMLYRDLTHLGYNVVRLVREEVDVALRERCRRANAIAKEVGVRNAILISVHINAAGGDGQWHSA